MTLPFRCLPALVLTLFASAALTGCAIGDFSANPASADPASAIAGPSGMAHGGQQPVASSTITLLAPSQAGYGAAPSVLATTTTNGSGGFTLPAYTCPAPTNTLVYITATGGNAGSGTNSSIGEAAVLGPCNSLSPATFINITEETTIAAAYALAPFTTLSNTAINVGVSATNLAGINNAFGPANNLAPFTTGVANSANAITGIVIPTQQVNTLADIIAACINSSTTSTVPTPCPTLFTNTTYNSITPINTFAAAIAIAQHPGSNTSALFNLATANPPYQPALPSAPADFTLALGYNGGGITLGGGTIGVAIDAAGDAWITTGYLNANVHSLTEISPAGTYLSGSTVANSTGYGSSVLSNPIGLAIDTNGLIDVVDNSPAAVIQFNPNGSYNATFTAASFYGPNSIAVDANNYIWVANFGSTNVTRLTPAGVEASNSPIAGASDGVDIAAGPLAIWETDHTTNSITRIDLSTFAATSFNAQGSTGGIAIDHSNNAWYAQQSVGNIYANTNTLTPINSTPYTFALNNLAQGIAIDGLGNIFASSYNSENSTYLPGSLVEYSSSGNIISSYNGYACDNLVVVGVEVVRSLSIDQSGNVWIAGDSAGSSLPIYVTEVIGVAAPAVNPLSVAAKNNTLGTRP